MHALLLQAVGDATPDIYLQQFQDDAYDMLNKSKHCCHW